MYELAKLGGYVLSPLSMALGLWLLAAVFLAMRRRRLALGVAMVAFAGLWVGSLPVVAQALIASLERQYPPMTLQATPEADVIVVLGGALAPPDPPRRPYFALGQSAGRIWHAARLYKAGKAKTIVIAAGNQPGLEHLQSEAEVIAEMLVSLGVPAGAIKRESRSRTTRENAMNVKALIQELGGKRVLLVTSAQHMPRAVKTFTKVWANSGIEFSPASADGLGRQPNDSIFVWIPSPNALLGVSKALKEYAGTAVLSII
jgi:uncharacterized SAM-binding protein YcdF (DUF218 family)